MTSVDPKEPHNVRITDIDRATPGTDRRVHFTSDLMVLTPVDPAKGNGVLLFDVVNRGNGYLMREGYTLVLVGWEFDLAPGTSRRSSSPTPAIRNADL